LSKQANEQFDVVFTTNREEDLKYLAVAGRSLMENCSQPDRVCFHVLYSMLDEAQLRRLEASWRGVTNSVNFYSMAERLGTRALDPGYGYWYRVFLGDVLPSSISRVLYLDCDVVVHGDIAELWSLQLGDKIAGVVWDPGYRHFGFASRLNERARKNALSFCKDGPYFNTGVLLIELNKWRSADVAGQVEQHFGATHHDSTLHDQDELNIVLQGQVLPLSPAWNLIEPIVLIENWDFEIYQNLADPETYFYAKIRHFAGPSKADSPLVRRSEKANFYSYLDTTDWAGWRSDSDSAWWGKPLSELVELHYMVVRGVRQGVLSQPLTRLRKQLQRAPYTALLYLGIPLYRAFLKIKGYFKRQGAGNTN
jgi:lipopolysaccharide biosynthesis glycosyltransferase